jgi:DNA-binding winged helix-turn-helix (wHTH) protein
MILDENHRTLAEGGKVVRLTAKECRLLVRLAQAKGKVVDWDRVISGIWPDPDLEPENARNVIHVLRWRIQGKLDAAGLPTLIGGLRGKGLEIPADKITLLPDVGAGAAGGDG